MKKNSEDQPQRVVKHGEYSIHKKQKCVKSVMTSYKCMICANCVGFIDSIYFGLGVNK